MSTEQRTLKAIQILDELIELAKHDLAESQRHLAKIKSPEESAPEPQRFTSQEFQATT